MAENEWDDAFKDSEAATADERAGKSKLKVDAEELKKQAASPIEEEAIAKFCEEVQDSTDAVKQKEAWLNLGKIVCKATLKAVRDVISSA